MKSPDHAAFKVILVIAVLIAIAVLPVAARADAPRQGPPTFEDFDADGDGFVSQAEFDQFRAERIAARAAEGRKMRGLANAPTFVEIDIDGDGQLSIEEFTVHREAHVKAMRARQGCGHGGGHDGGQGQGMHRKMQMPTFADLDLDGNGCIDADEFAQHQAQHHGARHGEQQAAEDTPE